MEDAAKYDQNAQEKETLVKKSEGQTKDRRKHY